MLIRDVFGLRKEEGDISFEIELEGFGLPHIVNNVWDTKRDGSLKGDGEGKEYLFNKPLPKEQLRDVMKEFISRFENADVLDSFYAGTHVHVNVQDLTPRQLINYIVLYLIMEDLLVDWCGSTRVGNHFCLRVRDASYLTIFLYNMIVDDDIENLDENLRYSSVNFMSVPKFGSLEFRALDSRLDLERLLTWANVLLNLRDVAITYDTPDQILSSVSSSGYLPFARAALGEENADQFLLEGWQRKMRRGVIHAQELAYAKNWRDVNFNIFRKRIFT